MKIGDKYTFCPSAFTGKPGKQGGDEFQYPKEVTGTVDYINLAHRWCDVVYHVHGYTLHEGFKIAPTKSGMQSGEMTYSGKRRYAVQEPLCWMEIYRDFKRGRISAAAAVKRSGLSTSSFYRQLHKTEKENPII